MIGAPQTLPFPLEPNPSPEEVKNTYMLANQRYVSSICRSGPIPTTSHSITDPICLIIYTMLLVATITLFCVNYFSGRMIDSISFSSLNLFEKIIYGLNNSLMETIFSCIMLISMGFFLMLLVIAIPYFAGYFIIFLCISLLGFIMYSLIILNSSEVWQSTKISQKKDNMTQVFRISLLVLVGMAILGIFYMIVTRFRKLKHLWAMMGIAKAILLSSLPLFPIFFLLVLSAIQVGIWCGFVRMMWNSVLMNYSRDLPINIVLIILFESMFIVWTYGLMFSISDYLCQSWIIHWYYKGQVQNSTALKQNWRALIFGKLFRFHFGTCLFGSFTSGYLSDMLIWGLKFLLLKRINQPKMGKRINMLSNYLYIQTIMQCLNFCSSNQQFFKLRQRIKQKLPEVYMLGYILQKILQSTLTIGALYIWFAFSYKTNKFIQNNAVLEYSISIFLLMCLAFTFGIFYQISSNISHLFGTISDTAVIVYCIDSQIQRVHFHQNGARSTPVELKKALQKLQFEIKVLDNRNLNQSNQVQGAIDLKIKNYEKLYPSLPGNSGEIGPFF